MTIFKCKMCGGTIEVKEGTSVGVCDYCGTKQTLPRLDDERRANLYDRANHFRRNNEFDKAEGIYEQILSEDNTDAEAYWSLVLCRYGIEYVEDPATHKRVPTVNRTQFTSIFDDNNYESALRYADGYQRAIYENEANAINEIQKGILALAQKEEPFDVFICYKETDHNGRRTPDSVLANDLYHQLTQEGFKVFFSRITLEDKLGTAYEPYIFAALNSSKVMVVLGTRTEYFNAVWVKNEWSRYLALVKQSGGKKVLIPAYKDMDPYDLPEEFSHLQAQDMSKLGFMQDLIRGIKKIAQQDNPKGSVQETAVVNVGGPGIKPLLKRAFLFLEDGDWESADAYCEKVLDQDPENAWAYLGKLMIELNIRRRENLVDYKQPLRGNSNYQKVVRFGSDKLRVYVTSIDERNENDRLVGIYQTAVNAMNMAKTDVAYKSAAEIFRTVSDFKDAGSLAEQCLDRAEACRKDAIYNTAKWRMLQGSESDYEEAIQFFQEVPGWRDANDQMLVCQQRIKEIKIKEEKQLVAAQKEWEYRIAMEKERERRIAAEMEEKRRIATAKRRKVFLSICVIFSVVIMTIVLSLFLNKRSKINNVYARAHALLDSGEYATAYALLREIGDNETIRASRCERALTLLDSGKYEEALSLFANVGDNEEIRSIKLDRAIALLNSENYEVAYALFAQIGDNEAIVSSKYDRAMKLLDSGDNEAAYMLLDGLNYKDSADKIDSIRPKLSKRFLLSIAQVGSFVSFGAYWQKHTIEPSDKEDIEWLVLAKEDNQILVISRYALDSKQYNVSYPCINWKSSSIREWLNDTFLNDAFSSEEQKNIVTTTISVDNNPKNGSSPENDNTDKVFLLSVKEAQKYFNTDEARKCRYATKEAKKQLCWWWLRSCGGNSNCSAIVRSDGSIDSNGYGVCNDLGAIRPALWINLEPYISRDQKSP